ncbi:MAG: cytochrome c [Betaproteobacteria bacterium]|nr:cytochrome c [Betaproteobacteria bacterium]
MKVAIGMSIAATALMAGAVVAQGNPVGNAERAKGKVSICIGCHGIAGYKSVFPEVYHVPMIAGQNPGYIANALKAYRSGDRTHPSMRGIARGLSDEDIADVAAYYSGASK